MPWSYSQSAGVLSRNGQTVARGYSGIGAGLNNPAMEAAHNVGPIPLGAYTVGAPFHHPHAGGYTMRLTPKDGTNVYGRTGLIMHGDSVAHPGRASNGCIIERLDARQRVWTSGDHVLTVTR